ncbi:MAG TPA: VCBS repeat-containing protein [Bryobacteraceae bacterium]
MSRIEASLCALLLLGYTPPAGAQSASSCQPAPPFINPAFSDQSSGWSATTSVAAARGQLAVGDINGDGNDELITLIKGQIQVWNWIQTGWSPAAAFPNSRIATDFGSHVPPPGSVTDPVQFGPTSLQLADVDGDGQKEIVVYVTYMIGAAPYPTWGDKELVYHYNKSLATWSLLTSYPLVYPNGSTSNPQDLPYGPSHWFKAHSTDTRDTRLTYDIALNLDVEQFVNGAWTKLPVAGSQALFSASIPGLNCTQTERGTHTDFAGQGQVIPYGGVCAAFTDVTGDGIADMVFLGYEGKTWVVPSTPQQYFGGTPIASSIPAVAVDPPTVEDRNTNPNTTTLAGWQMGDVDGDGIAELIFPTPDGALNIYKWAAQSRDFVPISAPGLLSSASVIPGTQSVSFLPATLTVVPKMFRGVTALTTGGPLFWVPYPEPPYYLSPFNSVIAGNAGFAPTGYSGFLRFAVENGVPVLIARSANGLVSEIPHNPNSLPLYVDAQTVTDRGYPAYSSSQQAAYQYISATATGNNPDIRSLYPDPAVPWAYLQQQIESMAAPPASSGISTADFQFVQKQTIAELTALQSVNAFFGVTGQILTNTYLVQDATLQEVTDVLGLPSNPDVTGPILSDVTNALGALGGGLFTAGAFLNLSKEVIDAVNQAAYLVSDLQTITADTATYTAPTPPDLSSGEYSLKISLDNSSLGALTANSCHQVAALSNWNEAKYIADGISGGTIPLDLKTQQDILVASQSLFEMNVWQALAPSKWDYVAVKSAKVLVNGSCGNCLFSGNSSYPLNYSIQANASCVAGVSNPYSLLLEDPSTHNYPNLIALNVLFSAPPNGLGVKPADVLLGNNNWSIPYAGVDLDFGLNTGYLTYSCSNFTIANPQLTPNIRGSSQPDSFIARPTAANLVNMRLARLIGDVKANLTDTSLRDRLLVVLEGAASRLQQAQQHQHEPTETLRLLNVFITQSQRHALQNAADREVSRTESIEAVDIRDSLINAEVAAAR